MSALIPTEAERLTEYERVIERGFGAFVEVGTRLAAIRDEKLYKVTHGTWEHYCLDRWNITARRSRQMIEAATVGSMLPISNARQAEELTGLPPETAREVYDLAVEQAPKGSPNSTHLAKAREQIAPRARVTETTTTEYDVDTSTGEVVEPPDNTAELVSDWVNSGGEYQLALWRQNYMKAIARAGQLMGFTPEVVAEKADALLLDEIGRLVSELTEYGERVRRATRGLRTIQGGRS